MLSEICLLPPPCVIHDFSLSAEFQVAAEKRYFFFLFRLFIPVIKKKVWLCSLKLAVSKSSAPPVMSICVSSDHL